MHKMIKEVFHTRTISTQCTTTRKSKLSSKARKTLSHQKGVITCYYLLENACV